MKRHGLILVALLLLTGSVSGQSADTALIQALVAEPAQCGYLSRHPEILRWIGKHPEQTPKVADNSATADEKAKNNAINEWILQWPNLARLLAQDTNQTLAWADEPRPLADLGKKGRK